MRTLLRVDLPAESHPTSPSLLALLAGRSLKVDGIGIREEDRGVSRSVSKLTGLVARYEFRDIRRRDPRPAVTAL